MQLMNPKIIKNDPYFDDFYLIFSFNKIKKRNGIAQKKWTKINVQFSKVPRKVRNDPP